MQKRRKIPLLKEKLVNLSVPAEGLNMRGCLILADSRRSGDEIRPWPPNGGNRPDPAIRGQDVNGRFLVLHCGAMVLEVGQQLGKLMMYLQPTVDSRGCPGSHLTVGRVPPPARTRCALAFPMRRIVCYVYARLRTICAVEESWRGNAVYP